MLKNVPQYGGVYINEDLIQFRAELLGQAGTLVKNKKLQSAWSYDGRIFVKCCDGSRRMISTKDELKDV